MAHAYTPGLSVRAREVLVRARRLPLRGQVLVAPGQTVHPDFVIARAELPGDVAALNVANLLGAAPDELPRLMLKHQGDTVATGEPLAATKPWLGLFKSVVRAPADGCIESVSAVTGQVLLRGPARAIELRAFLGGTVDEIIPEYGAAIRCVAARVQGIFGIGTETWGTLAVVSAPGEPLTPHVLNEAHRGAIVVSGGLATRHALERAAELGVRGVVAAGLRAADLRPLLGYDIGVAVTGDEPLPVTVMVTEGFGDIAMADRAFALLSAHAGAQASLSARTQIRAGVIRPELIVSLGGDAATAGDELAAEDRPLALGDRVRLVRDPWFGRLGVVTALPVEPMEIETGARVRVMTVALDDGRTITVPRANAERLS